MKNTKMEDSILFVPDKLGRIIIHFRYSDSRPDCRITKALVAMHIAEKMLYDKSCRVGYIEELSRSSPRDKRWILGIVSMVTMWLLESTSIVANALIDFSPVMFVLIRQCCDLQMRAKISH